MPSRCAWMDPKARAILADDVRCATTVVDAFLGEHVRHGVEVGHGQHVWRDLDDIEGGVGAFVLRQEHPVDDGH